MSMDGWYVAKSHGWRCDECPWKYGIPQGAMDGGETNVHGSTVFRKKPGKAVWLYPWMDGMPQGARDGGAAIAVYLIKRYA